MPYTLLEPVLYDMGTAGAALATSTTATDISANPQYVMPGNTVTTQGQTLILHASGIYGTTTGSNSMILGFYRNTQTTSGATGVGGIMLAASGAFNLTASMTNMPWEMYCEGVFQAVGSSGTCWAYGHIDYGVGSTSASTAIDIYNVTGGANAGAGFNTTVANLITVGATWGTSNASNTITCEQFRISLAN